MIITDLLFGHDQQFNFEPLVEAAGRESNWPLQEGLDHEALTKWFFGSREPLVTVVVHDGMDVVGYGKLLQPNHAESNTIWTDAWSGRLGRPVQADELAELCRLMILPEFRGQGWIQQIVDRLLGWTITFNCLPCATTFDDREPGIQLLTSLGWEQVGETLLVPHDRKMLLWLPPYDS